MVRGLNQPRCDQQALIGGNAIFPMNQRLEKGVERIAGSELAFQETSRIPGTTGPDSGRAFVCYRKLVRGSREFR